MPAKRIRRYAGGLASLCSMARASRSLRLRSVLPALCSPPEAMRQARRDGIEDIGLELRIGDPEGFEHIASQDHLGVEDFLAIAARHCEPAGPPRAGCHPARWPRQRGGDVSHDGRGLTIVDS